ncbi:MAG TPA: GAF domain-containing protein [Candidatus Saccharimonadales bacterium]|nr:GAF domain-containing protein [Candidatus Saccharimonadales bacterium]
MSKVKNSLHKPLGDDDITYLSFLSRAVQEFNKSSEYNSTLINVAHSLVPEISDWCAIDIADNSGTLKRVATAHIDPGKVQLALELGRKYPRDKHSDSGTPYVFRTGEPNMWNKITDDMLVANAINDEHLEMMRAMKFHSLMIVPIKSRGRALGTITFVWAESANEYTLTDLAFAEILAALAGSAIDIAQLTRETKKAKVASKAN